MAFFVSACRRPAMIAKARLNSCSVITFACAIAQIPVSISETLHSGDSGGQPEMVGRAGQGVNGVQSPKSHFPCCVIAKFGIIFDGNLRAGKQAQ